MANTLKLGAGKWATGTDTVLAFNDENNNFKPLPFDFSRASSATVVNQSGLIETVGSGTPRIDFLGNTKGALLLEPQRTNSLLQSNQFDTTWTLSASIDLTSGQSGVGGSNNAWLLKRNSTGSRYIQQSLSLSSAQYSYSVYLKAESTNWAYLWSYDGSASVNAYFDLENGVVGQTGGAALDSTNIESVGNGWYRCTLIYTHAPDLIRIYPAYSSGSISTGTDSGIYIQHAQLEVGSYPTSIIPTSASAVTRVADVCNNGANAQVINSTEGVLFVETKGFTDLLTQSGYIQLSKNGESSATNSLIIQHRSNGSLRVYVNGFATPDIHFNINIDFTENHKIAVLYKLNGYKLFIDGIAQSLYSTPTQAVFSGLDNLSFDLRGALSWNSSIKDVKIYNTALTDAELAALTTI